MTCFVYHKFCPIEVLNSRALFNFCASECAKIGHYAHPFIKVALKLRVLG